jgi:Zn-dependent protease/CBS domain-containing protein
MQSDLKLGTIFGIQVGFTYAWFLIALLIFWSFASSFHSSYPQWNWLPVGAWALVSTVVFFASLLLHELAHCLTARYYGIPIKRITLFALGGVSDMEKEPSRPASEFWIAAAGPAMSGLLGASFVGLAHLFPRSPFAKMLLELGYINIVLALFNLLPGYPMDGGRILRAIIWSITGDFGRSTRFAGTSGQVVGLLFAVGGLFLFFRTASFTGLWLALIGWFLMRMARESDSRLQQEMMFQHIRVQDVMNRTCLTVPGEMSLADLVEHELLRTGHRCYVVLDRATPIGLITPHRIKAVGSDEWHTTAVRTAMLPLDKSVTVDADSPLSDAIQAMISNDINQVPVLKGGEVLGLLSRSDVMQFLHTYAELHAEPAEATK